MTIDVIRKELNISQEQLARDLNIIVTTNHGENGRSTPSRLAKMRLYECCTSKDISKEALDFLDRN